MELKTPRFRGCLRAALASALVLVCAVSASPSVEDEQLGAQKAAFEKLRKHAHFQALPKAVQLMCAPHHQGRPVRFHEFVEVAPGILGSQVFDPSMLENGRLVREPQIRTWTFGGLVMLRGSTKPAMDILVEGDRLFPLAEGKSTKITFVRADERLENDCTTRNAPGRFDLGLPGGMHLVTCKRKRTDTAGNATGIQTSYALCNNHVGFCPLQWQGELGYEGNFDFVEVQGQRYAPVQWRCGEFKGEAYDW